MQKEVLPGPGSGPPSGNGPIRVTLVEDDSRVRESLAILIDGAPGLRCIGCYDSAEAALSAIPVERPDVVLMDIHLGRMSGIECVRKLHALEPSPVVVMLTAYEDDELIFQALKAGASGYLVKQTPPSELLDAIVEVHGGGAPMSSNIARKVIRSFHETDTTSAPGENLSERESEILNLLSKGYQYKEISEFLDLAYETVHTHLRKIYRKLHVRSRSEAITKFLKR